MNPALTIGNATIWLGECREVMKTLPADSVQCVVTSPPYFGLRDYGTASWEGGKETCDHQIPASTLGGGTNKGHPGSFTANYRAVCGKCGAKRIDQQIGLEATPAEYVATMVDVFREIRRILRPDGVVWLNLGDSYNSAKNGNTNGGSSSGLKRDGRPEASRQHANATQAEAMQTQKIRKNVLPSLKQKELIGIPWRTAFALQDDGWYLRAEIIWAKPNPMPESVTDRVSRSHEQLFMLTRSPRYYYDKEAIAEPVVSKTGSGNHSRKVATAGQDSRLDTHLGSGIPWQPTETRNARSVWTITPAIYKGAHYAVMPDELAKRCILASTSDQACDVCGAPWKRIVERIASGYDGSKYGERAVAATGGAKTGGTAQSTLGSSNGKETAQYKTVGWEPTCKCPTNHGLGRCIVFDPFAGAGTTPKVAITHGRTAWGSELNPANIELIAERLDGVALRLV